MNPKSNPKIFDEIVCKFRKNRSSPMMIIANTETVFLHQSGE
jgi:hypothetical protein